LSEAIPHFIMIGGFLGAGKTTAVSQLARHLTESGLRVGLIANDQSSGLVDTAILKSHGFAVQEISGGCFCCRFNSLKEAADVLTREVRPEVFLAEPVGSCTDLVATVSYPLRRLYGEGFRIAPLSVMVDPRRAARVLGLRPGRVFSSKAEYIYKKQLEEAAILVINKSDTLDPELEKELTATLRERYPAAEVILCSAKNDVGLDRWLEKLTGSASQPEGRALEIDYELYAEGEALLGWLNTTVKIQLEDPIDANRFVQEIALRVRDMARAAEIPLAHLKMTVDGEDKPGTLSVVSLVNNEDEPDLRESLLDEISHGRLIINLRAEGSPDDLLEMVKTALRETAAERPGMKLIVEHEEHFRPAPPKPTHRVSV